jgi:hypothetical protein
VDSDRLSRLTRWQGLEQAREVFGHRLPQDIEVDVEVVVDEAVTHASGSGPGDSGFGGPQFGADLLGSFADDLDEFGNGESQQLVTVEVCPLSPCAVRNRFGRSLGGVPQADLVVRPRKPGVRSRPRRRGRKD